MSEKASFQQRVRDILATLRSTSSLWHEETRDFGWCKRQLIFALRTVRLVARGFRNDDCNLHAAALTYYTLMAIVPLLALGLSIARAFGGGELARHRITSEISRLGSELSASTAASATEESAEMATQFIEHITTYVDQIFEQIGNISFGTLGGIGLIVLLWMAIATLSQVERSFNSVWDAPPRDLWRKCSDYLTIIIIVPFLGIAASTIPIVSTATKIAHATIPFISDDEWLTRAINFLVTAVLNVTTFVVLLMAVPNTKVKFKAGLVGGILTAVLFAAWLKICTSLQVGVVKYSKLYGGFAALPILLAWAYMSWQIILLGAEIAFAVQHSETFFRDEGARDASLHARCLLTIAIVRDMARRMMRGEKPLDLVAYTSRHGVSGRLARELMSGLEADGIVAATAENPDAYTLTVDPARLTVRQLVLSLVNRGTSPESLGLGDLDAAARAYIEKTAGAVGRSLDSSIASIAEMGTAS